MEICETQFLSKIMKNRRLMILLGTVIFIIGISSINVSAGEESAAPDRFNSTQKVEENSATYDADSVNIESGMSVEERQNASSEEADKVTDIYYSTENNTVNKQTITSSNVTAPLSRKSNTESSGDQFVELRKKLKELGYLSQEYNSDTYDETMKQAISLFQLYNGISNPDGIAGEKTIQLLNGTPAPYKNFSLGEKNSQILWIQKKLSSMGYLNVAPDGVWGKRSAEGIRLMSIYKNGRESADNQREELYLLFSKNDLKINNISGLMKNGDSGNPDINKARIRLYQAGFIKPDRLKMNGVFDNELELAVRAYQLSGGIVDDGLIGNWTAANLNRMSIQFNGIYTGERSQRVKRLQELLKADKFFYGKTDYIFGNKTGISISSAQSALGYRQTGYADLNLLLGLLAVKKYQIKPNLIVGETGSDVEQLCRELVSLGYLSSSNFSEIYDKNVKYAVWKFQLINEISTPDGIAGRLTRARLYSSPVKFHEFNCGEKGNGVKVVQEYLYNHGFLVVNPDGIWGKKSINGATLWKEVNSGSRDFSSLIDYAFLNTGEYINRIVSTNDLKNSPETVRNVKMRLYLHNLWDEEFSGEYSEKLRNRIGTVQILGGIIPDCILGNWTSNFLNQNHDLSNIAGNRTAMYGIQSTLYSNGCLNVNPDGILGNKTRAGISEFCSLSGMSGHSELDIEVLDKMAQVRTLFRKLSLDPREFYGRGIKGESVKEIQNALLESRYGNFKQDGIFGAITKGAVVSFQIDNNIAGDGIVGKATLYKMFVNGHKVFSDVSKGDHGSYVLELQKYLSRIGVFNEVPDGNYNESTESAVKNFQKLFGIDETGILDNITAQKLFSLYNRYIPALKMTLDDFEHQVITAYPSYNSWVGNNPEYIVIHHWGDDGQQFMDVVNWLRNPASKVSANYVVEGGRCARLVDETNAAWHAGNRWYNKHSVGIECKPEMDSYTFNYVVATVAMVYDRVGKVLPLIGHKDVVATACPGRYYSRLREIQEKATVIFMDK